MPPSRDSFRRNRVAPIDTSILAFMAGARLLASALGIRGFGFYFVGDHYKFCERRVAKRGGDGTIGGVASGGDQHAADARHVVASVERPPSSAKIDLEPRAEIHRVAIGRHADVTEITGCVARGNIERAAKRDRQMLEISANADALGVNAESGARAAGELVGGG